MRSSRTRNFWLGCAALAALCANPAFGQKTPEEETKTLKVPEGFEAKLFAAEPLIVNPSAIDVDTKGRVWAAEIQWYRGKAKNPPADCIKVLEDTDGDGVADKATVFAEGVFAPMSVCVAGTKVYVATSPDLWVYEDKDGDLKADGPPEKLLTGFGGKNHDHGAHSLVLGPDHKWWMAHGDTGFNVSGKDGSKMEHRWGGMLRGELDGTKLEAYAVNFRNPYELGVSSFGESFCSDNDNDGNRSVRICWIVDGGDYGWFGGPPFGLGDVPKRIPPNTPFAEAWHFRGHIPGNFPGTLVTGFGSPCGMCFYEGDAFGPKYKNAPWHADAGPREVRIYRHELAGYGMKATSENVVTTTGDAYFRPDDVCASGDGSLYVSDWYDGGVGGHGYNDPTRGRIFRLTPKDGKLSRKEKPGPYSTIEDAVVGLGSPNLATQFLAREKLLAAGPEAVPALEKLFASAEDPNHKARALWVLDRVGGSAREKVVAQLRSTDSSFRALAVRILRRHGAEYAPQLFKLIGDSSKEVRREVLLAASKNDSPEALDVIAAAAADYDGSDRYLLEELFIASKSRKDQVYEKLDKANLWTAARLPLLQLLRPEEAAKKLLAALADEKLPADQVQGLLAAVGALPNLEAARGTIAAAGRASLAKEVRSAALELVSGNLSQSWNGLVKEAVFQETVRKLLADSALRAAALKLVADHRLLDFAPDLEKNAKDAAAASPSRREALGLLVSLKAAGLSDTLRALLKDENEEVRSAALAGLIEIQDNKTLRDVLGAGKASPAVQSDAVARLMASTGGSLVLLRLIDEKAVDDKLKSEAVAAAIKHPDANVRVLFEKFVPEAQRPKRLGAEVKAAEVLALKGNAEQGSKIFFQSTAAQCKNCHVVRGVGTALGPDLSQIGKKFGPEAMLESIMDPSKAISHEFKPYVVETSAGQIFVGFVVRKDDKELVLKDIRNQLIRIPTADIEIFEEQKKSMMPELILKEVTAQDAADLLAFLTGLKEDFVTATQFQVLGPFEATEHGGLERPYPVEKEIGKPNFTAKYKGKAGKEIAWQVVPTDAALGFPAVDTVKLSESKKIDPNATIYYFALVVESATEQEAVFQIGSDDGVAAWLNGKKVHANDAHRPLAPNEDRFKGKLKAGKNVFVAKVRNGDGGGGFCLTIGAAAPVKLLTE